MKDPKYNTARRLTRVIAVPLASVIITVLWSMFFWEAEHFLLSAAIVSAINVLYFSVLYVYVFPAMVQRDLMVYILLFTLFFTAGYTFVHLQLFRTGILVYPPPFINRYYPELFFVALFSVIGLTIYFSALSVYLILYTYLLSHESYHFLQKSYQSEISALRLQMNPHFISNSLNNLGNMLRNREKENALQYTNELIELLDEQLKYSNAETVILKDELNWIEYYLHMEQQRMNGNFQYRIVVGDPSLYTRAIPPMILQPIIENCIHHGFHPSVFTGKGEIVISITKRRINGIRILITDNGIGNKMKPQTAHKDRSSISTENIRKRIMLINELGDFYITESRSSGETGTTCEINLHVNLLG